MNFHEIMPDDVRDVYHKLSAGRCENGLGSRYRMNATNIRRSRVKNKFICYAEAQQYKRRVSGKYTDKMECFLSFTVSVWRFIGKGTARGNFYEVR